MSRSGASRGAPARRGVALGGFMGAGKTSVGRRLAERLGLPFLDLDAELVARFGPIPEQFAQVGEAGFRSRERALVDELCDGVPRVVATGGGAWVDPESRRRLASCYRTVVLTAPIHVLRQRVGDDPGRPLWGPDAPARLAQREQAYADAERVVDTSERGVDEVVDEVVAWLGEAR